MPKQALGQELPERIGRLDELASNLWWCWHRDARNLFRALDYPLWVKSGKNPIRQLRGINADKLHAAVSDPEFVAMYDSVISAFDADMSRSNTWFAVSHPDLLAGPVAYFSMEFAIDHSLPIYAGGLGVLAGDICKEASDLGLPLVGVGFMYPQGYFHQCISADGCQQEIYRQLDLKEAPVTPVISSEGRRALAEVYLENRLVHIAAWRIQAGRTAVYLLDTNIVENNPQDRDLSARLYVADQELRIQQEIVLGIGGVRILRALGIKPAIWHMNEGHTAFTILERLREEIEKGATFAEAAKTVRETTVLTTHTPVPAGHDAFPLHLMDRYFGDQWGALEIDRETFLKLGQMNGSSSQEFNMSALALRMSSRCNAVSQLHGVASRKMWQGLWPELPEEMVPISHVTNGVHVPTWIASDMAQLFEKYLGRDWVDRHDDPQLWDRVMDISNEELWATRQLLKRRLSGAMLGWVHKRWSEVDLDARQVLATGVLLHPELLTIGYVRRFAEYKRPALIFQDIERLKRMVKDRWRPVQIVFAGKSHPADLASKNILRQVYTLATDSEFRGRIAFVEDYSMYAARYLVHGVDVWLNVPRRLNEASGTSGMKASLNGILHLSVPDGWWYEGYNGVNGWTIGDGPGSFNAQDEDKSDAEALYRLLEDEIVPLYYDRDRFGVPHGWVSLIKEAIRSIVPNFCARRMLKQYVNQLYTGTASLAAPQNLMQ